MLKTCPHCSCRKPLEAFSPAKKGVHRRSSWCRDCARQLYHDRKARDPETFKIHQHDLFVRNRAARYKAHNKMRNKYKIRNRDYLIEWISHHPCVDCGEADPVVLELDHVRGMKLYDVSWLVMQGLSIRKLEEEIAKCEVVCANCHRRRTAKRAGWVKAGEFQMELTV